MEQTHSQHIIKLQHSLREEIDGRQAAERVLAELRGEVSIGIEDMSPVVQAQGMRDNIGLFTPLLASRWACVLYSGEICVHVYICGSICVGVGANVSKCVCVHLWIQCIKFDLLELTTAAKNVN